MTTTVKQVFGALAALVLSSTAALAATTGSATKPIGASDDLTTSSSGAVDSYSGAYTISAGWYEPYKAFDGNLPVDQNSANTKALIASAEGKSDRSQTSPRWIVYKFNVATAVNAIGVYPNGYWGNGSRCPMNWTFDASNDGSTWTTLDTRTGETAWTEFAYRYFEFQNDSAYQYYRFYCTSLCGVPNTDVGSHLELGELEFYYVATVAAPIVTDGGATVSGTSATITGSLDALGAGASSATVTLEYGTTAALGSSAPVDTYTEATDPISATLTGLSYDTTYYYAFKAVNNAPTPQTGWSETNSFVVEASTRFSDTLGISTSNCRATVTGAIESWGLGTTEASLLVGASANDLAVVQTMSLSAEPANDEVAFDSFTRAAGTWYVAVRAVTTYNGSVWTNDTAATAMTLADAATYTWKGGKGAWTDPAMWTTTDADAGGAPSAASSVVIGDADSYIELSSSPTVANLTLSSAGRHEFRSNWMSTKRTLSVDGTFAFAGAGGGTVVLDSVETTKNFADLGGIRHLVVENQGSLAVMHAAAGANGDFSGTAVTLVDGGTLTIKGYNNNAFSFGKLTAIGGPSVIDLAQNYAVTATFASFEARDGSGLPVVNVRDGIVSFADTTGIEMVGGTDTLADPGPQIPVCTQFQLSENSIKKAWGCGACTLDGGTIRAIPDSTMLDSFAGATALDNVCITNATAVSADVTVNAVLLGRANLDLGGHTVTVQSGVCRERTAGALYKVAVANGTFRLARPSAFCDGNGNGCLQTDYATSGNADATKPMLALNASGLGYPSHANYADFTGLFSMILGGTFTLKGGVAATNAVPEMRGGTLTAADHNIRLAYRGLAGVSTWTHQKWYPFLYLGVPDGDEYWTDTTKKAMVVVGDKGILAPGVVDYDGGRRGCIVLSYHAYLTDLVFRDGAELQVALHDDGTSSYVDLTETSSAGSYIDVTLAGTISVATTKKVPMGVKYPVIKYQQGKLTGRFANVTQGFKVQYDVLQPDGAYAVTVERKNVGTFIIIR
ncbi:MAG: fibronectin type III domain-containing protein [Kiritimatiellae bacterium]|nr:fibronectin type III domain-containing protein [Kiritimatiellia bacterium]